MPLGIEGFTYADLQVPSRLGDLYELFCRQVEASDPQFWSEWDAYRAAPDAPRTPQSKSELIVRMAPRVSRFIATLFGVEDAAGAINGQTTELDVPVYAGWASVLSPVQLDILLDGKLVGSTEIEKLMLKPGKHTLELVNESLGYRGSVEVRVRPGSTTSVSVVPKTPVAIEAPEGTELSINGENMGTLPNAALQVPLGTAEFVMRYKDEERRQVVPVTMSAPVTVKFELATVVDR